MSIERLKKGTSAVLLGLIVAVTAANCAGDGPVAPGDGEEEDNCYYIDGVMICD